jgi:hypothetical protein
MLFFSVPFTFAYGIIYSFSTDYPLSIFKVAISFIECIFGADSTVMCLFTLVEWNLRFIIQQYDWVYSTKFT